MSNDKRLDRLYPALSAKERGILTLRDYKAGEPQDERLRTSTPSSQADIFNHYVDIMDAANGDLAHLIVVIGERVAQEELRCSWLDWTQICGEEMWLVRAHLSIHGREPVTESEYSAREAEARKELIPVEECAMLYTEYRHAWDDTDCEVDEDGERVPTDEAWDRVHDATLARSAQLVPLNRLSTGDPFHTTVPSRTPT